jgi:shikimate dehydrogenase
MLVYAVLGDPIGHSLSPVMQNAAFAKCCLSSTYLSFRVTKKTLQNALIGAQALGFGGLNLTVPLKEPATGLVHPDETARAIRAVNTVTFRGDEMLGYNTDAKGSITPLKDAGVGLRGAEVLLIGAGGAARAIAYQLGREGAVVTVVNRSRDRAIEIASAFGLTARPIEELSYAARRAELIINATTIGMREEDPNILEKDILRPDQTVYDIIYNRDTRLLADARAAGCKTIDGVMMLVHQGAIAFQIWTGLDAPIAVMENAVRDALFQKQSQEMPCKEGQTRAA